MKRYVPLFGCVLLLAPLEARAFFGPTSQIIAPVAAENAFYHYELSEEARPLAMPKWSAGQFFMIKDKHYKAVSEAKASVFESRVINWLKGEFDDSSHIDGKPDAELLELVRAGIDDARRLETPMREKDILDMVAVRATVPELMEDKKVWNAIMAHKDVNPYQRTRYFKEIAFRHISKSAREVQEYYWRMGRFDKYE